MLGDRLAEGLALLGVADRILHRRPGDADAARRDVDPPQLQPAERVAQAEALLAADQVGGRDAVVVEDQFGGIDALVARSEEHKSQLQSLTRNSYSVLCLKKKQ